MKEAFSTVSSMNDELEDKLHKTNLMAFDALKCAFDLLEYWFQLSKEDRYGGSSNLLERVVFEHTNSINDTIKSLELVEKVLRKIGDAIESKN